MPISEDDFKRFSFILMYDDETVLDAIATYRDTARAADWWWLLVDLGGRYAFTTFSDLRGRIEREKKTFLELPLGQIPADLLKAVDVVVEQASSDTGSALEQARGTGGQVAVVISDGVPVGLLFAGTQRSAGLFGSDLVKLAGQYADLPTTGLISRRRQEAMAAKKKKE